MDYRENRSKFAGKKNGSQFTDAVNKIDEYILNPTVCIVYNTNFIQNFI